MMEFYLVKEKRSTFRHVTGGGNNEFNVKAYTTPSGQPLTLDSVNSFDTTTALTDDIGFSKDCRFRKDLISLLCTKNFREGLMESTSESAEIYLVAYVTMNSRTTASMKLVTGDLSSVNVREEKRNIDIFERLSTSELPPTSFGFNLKLKLFLDASKTSCIHEFNAFDLKIKWWNDGFGRYGIKISNLEITKELWRVWNNHGEDVEGEMTLTLKLDHCAVKTLYLGRFEKNFLIKWPQKMLLNGFGSDMIILTGSEKNREEGIKCHKFILSDRSPVFQTMLQTDMSESKTRFLEIVDMTKNGIQALLEFIYCYDLEQAAKHSETAFELLKAGHKYQMEDLENATTEIFCSMSFQWVSVDLAVRLLIFSRKANLQKCERRSLEILKCYAQKSKSLVASEEFRKLYLDDPQVALEFGESFLRI